MKIPSLGAYWPIQSRAAASLSSTRPDWTYNCMLGPDLDLNRLKEKISMDWVTDFSGNVTGMYNQCCFIDCLVPHLHTDSPDFIDP